MKELNIYIFTHTHSLSTVTEILRRHNIAGMAFSEIHATGHTKRKEVPEMVRSYQTGKMITPEHEKRTKVETLCTRFRSGQYCPRISKEYRDRV